MSQDNKETMGMDPEMMASMMAAFLQSHGYTVTKTGGVDENPPRTDVLNKQAEPVTVEAETVKYADFHNAEGKDTTHTNYTEANKPETPAVSDDVEASKPESDVEEETTVADVADKPKSDPASVEADRIMEIMDADDIAEDEADQTAESAISEEPAVLNEELKPKELAYALDVKGTMIDPDPDLRETTEVPAGVEPKPPVKAEQKAAEKRPLSKRQYKKMLRQEEKAARTIEAEGSKNYAFDNGSHVTILGAQGDMGISKMIQSGLLKESDILEKVPPITINTPEALSESKPASVKRSDFKKAARLAEKAAAKDYKQSELTEIYNEHDTIEQIRRIDLVKQRLKRTANLIMGSVDVGEEEITFPHPPLTMASTLMPVSDIQGGIIETTFGSYAHIIEVKPNRPYKNVLISFEQVAKVFPDDIQLKVFTRDAYVKPITERFEEHIHKETSKKAKEIGTEHVKMIENLASSDAVSKRYFIIVSYQPNSKTFRNFHSASMYFEEVLPKLVTEIEYSGLTVLTEAGDSNAQAEIIYDVANRNRSHFLTFSENMSLVEGEYEKKYGDIEHIPVAEFLTATRIDTTMPECVYADGFYYTYLMFRPEGIPTQLTREWILKYANINRNCDVDIFFHKENRDKAVFLSKAFGHVGAGMAKRAAKKDSEDAEEYYERARSNKYIHDTLKGSEDQDLYYVTVLLTLAATSREELRKLREGVMRDANRIRKSLLVLNKKQHLAYRASLPLFAAPKKFIQLGRRNMISSNIPYINPMECTEKIERDSLFCGFVLEPYIIKDLGDEREYQVGTILTQYLYSYNPWDTRVCANANLSIFGGSGKGKSYTLHNLCTQCRLKHIPVYLMIPEKGHEFKRICDAIGGEFVSVFSTSKDRINPLEIVPSDVGYIEGETEDEMAVRKLMERPLLDMAVSSVSSFCNMVVEELSARQNRILRQIITALYKEWGFTGDNESAWFNREKGIVRRSPKLKHLVQKLENVPELEDLYEELLQYVDGTITFFDGDTTVDFKNEYVVFDFTNCDERMRPLMALVVLNRIWGKVKEDKDARCVMAMDELWSFISGKSGSFVAEQVSEIPKLIRAYSGSFMFSTQEIKDLLKYQDGMFGNSLIANSQNWVLLGMEPTEASLTTEKFHLSADDERIITHLTQGQAMLRSGNDRTWVKFTVSKAMDALINTSVGSKKEA